MTLDEYILKHEKNLSTFARKIDADVSTMWRIRYNVIKNPTLEIMAKIISGSGGRVTFTCNDVVIGAHGLH